MVGRLSAPYEVRKALRDLLELKPDYAEFARELHGRWIQPALVEHMMQGLRKAGSIDREGQELTCRGSGNEIGHEAGAM